MEQLVLVSFLSMTMPALSHWVTKLLLMFTGLLVSVSRPDFNLGHQAHNIKITMETPLSLTVAQVTGLLVQFQSALTPTPDYTFSLFISA